MRCAPRTRAPRWRLAQHLASLGLLGTALASCEHGFFAAPAPPHGPATIALAVASAAAAQGGAHEAFDKADSVRVTLTGSISLDTALVLAGGGGGARTVTLALPLHSDSDSVAVAVELRAGSAALFRSLPVEIELRRGRTSDARITLEPVLARIALAQPPTMTALGDTLRLAATAMFASGDTIPGTPVTWRSLNPEIVAVSSGGLATSRAEGDATVEAAVAGDSRPLTATTQVRVHAVVARVDVNPNVLQLPLDQTQPLAYAPRDANGNALLRPAAWASSAPAVASVDATGLVHALAEGVASITATVEGKAGAAQVTVVNPVTSVTVQPGAIVLSVGDSVGADATLLDARGRALTNRQVAWTSADAHVAVVQGTGLHAVIRAVAPGVTTVTAASEGKAGAMQVTVGAPLIAATPASVVLSAPVAGTANATVALSNAGTGQLSGLSLDPVLYASGQPQGWLSAALGSTSVPADVTLSADASGLSAGTYGASITIRSNQPGVAALSVPISITVIPAVIGTYRVSYYANAGGCQGNPNPYFCVYIAPGPIHVSVPPGTYRVDLVSGQGLTGNPAVWDGDASNGVHYSLGATFQHSSGQITLYHYDWFPYDNDPASIWVFQVVRLR